MPNDIHEARLLVVDDEPTITELLTMSLRYAGFKAEAATNGREALAMAVSFRPDVILLDVGLPQLDGFNVVQRLRGDGSRIPVIFLTARKSDADRLTGLTIGADDYVTKPFSLEEVVARIRIVLGRAGHNAQAQASSLLKFADIELDNETHEVWKAGQEVALSPTEFDMIRFFMNNAGKVLSKRQILDHVWHDNFSGDANVVEAYVSHLRKKVDTTNPRLLHTLRGVGYVLRVPRQP